MEKTTALIHDFLKGVKPEDQDKVRTDMYPYFNPEQKKYVRKYNKVGILNRQKNRTRILCIKYKDSLSYDGK
jgi:hypothetical protein